MLRIAVVSLGLIVVGLPPFELNGAQAQDIGGMEDCTKTAGLDKRTGCFQSNVNFLHQLVTKNALDARQRLNAANNEIVALKAALASLQTTVEQLQAAHKSANEKKPQAK
jgi:formate dehydrogenase assembly factor FdhD